MREQLCMQGLGVAACFSVRVLLLDLHPFYCNGTAIAAVLH
jgi:hypothetical protein